MASRSSPPSRARPHARLAALLAAALGAALAGESSARESRAAPPQILASGAGWRASDVPGLGWAGDQFDDSRWSTVETPCSDNPDCFGDPRCSPANCLGIATAAQWIWSPTRQPRCYVRTHVLVQGDLERAELLVLADDNVRVYVNGLFVQEWDTLTSGYWGTRGCAAVVDLLPFLRAGDNVLAFDLTDRMLRRGLAAEVRLNSPPLFAVRAPQEEAAAPLSAAEVQPRLAALADRLGAPTWGEREDATAELLALVRRLPDRGRAFLEELRGSTDPETAWRAQAVLDAVSPPKAPAGTGDALSLPDLGLDGLVALLTSDLQRPRNLYRHCHAAAAVIEEDGARAGTELAALLRPGWSSAIQARVVQMADLLEARALLPAVREYVRTAADDLTLVWAVSALAKMGTTEDVELLDRIAAGHPESAGELAQAIHRVAAWGVRRIQATR